MKENVLDVLMYLFQNYLSMDMPEQPDRDSVQDELLAAGFLSAEIGRAFDWLDGLAERLEAPATLPQNPSFRIYGEQEIRRLTAECQGYILFLEQIGILDAQTRELVIDRVLALNDEDLDLTDLKWIVLMVLFSHPEQEEAYASMEDLLWDEEAVGYRH